MKKIIIIIFYIFSGPVVAQEVPRTEDTTTIETIQKEVLLTNISVTQDDIIQFQRESIWQLATLNVAYLAISITVLLFLGAIFYLFNLAPFVKKLNLQERNLQKVKKTVQGFFELAEKQNKLNKEIEGKIDKYKKEVEQVIKQSLDLSQNIINEIKDQELRTTQRLEMQQNSFQANDARSMALHSEIYNDRPKIILNWLLAAFYFHKIEKKNSNIIPALQRTEAGIKRITQSDKELLNYQPIIEEKLNYLEKEYSEQIRKIRPLWQEKLSIIKNL